VELWADAGIAVERSEAKADLVSLWPVPAEQTRAADRTEGLHASVVRPEDADQLLPGEQSKTLARNTSLRATERTRVLRQREQWQWLAQRKGVVTSKRTPLHKHEAWSGLSGLGGAATSPSCPPSKRKRSEAPTRRR
jgi:hypothetical protein